MIKQTIQGPKQASLPAREGSIFTWSWTPEKTGEAEVMEVGLGEPVDSKRSETHKNPNHHHQKDIKLHKIHLKPDLKSCHIFSI